MRPSEKFKELRGEMSRPKFAEKYKVGAHTIKYIEEETQSIPDDLALALEKEYGIPFKWWKTGEGSMFIDESREDCIELPLITVSCGGGYTQSENQVVLIDKQQLIGLGFRCFDKFVACQAVGDSMNPDIKEDDLLIINTLCDIKDGRIYVINANGELFCKKIRRGIKYFIMESINEKYPEETFTQDELSAINIIGQVITVIRKIRI